MSLLRRTCLGRTVFGMDEAAIEGALEVMALQRGVLSRCQALDHGLADDDIRRQLRRREWATVHPGVYVDHMGPPIWRQRAWAAVLACAPAALPRVGPARSGRPRTQRTR